jgi:hypothetical protein
MKNYLLKAMNVISAGFMEYFMALVGGFLQTLAIILGAGAVVVSLALSLAVPAFCVVAIWAILKYFGVL